MESNRLISTAAKFISGMKYFPYGIPDAGNFRSSAAFPWFFAAGISVRTAGPSYWENCLPALD
jgi:hypothetical protein